MGVFGSCLTCCTVRTLQLFFLSFRGRNIILVVHWVRREITGENKMYVSYIGTYNELSNNPLNFMARFLKDCVHMWSPKDWKSLYIPVSFLRREVIFCLLLFNGASCLIVLSHLCWRYQVPFPGNCVYWPTLSSAFRAWIVTADLPLPSVSEQGLCAEVQSAPHQVTVLGAEFRRDFCHQGVNTQHKVVLRTVMRCFAKPSPSHSEIWLLHSLCSSAFILIYVF